LIDPASEVYTSNYKTIKQYVDLLASDGVTRGLIGPREIPRLWDRHILNSAALDGLIPSGSRVIDVGSGAGLPGIPLAILRPDLEMTLLEPLLRRSTFLVEAVEALQLSSVRVIRGRAEDHTEQYDVVTSRALAPLGRLLGWCNPLRSPGGVILALKGQSAAEEITTATSTLAQLRLRAEIIILRPHRDADTATVISITGA